MKLKDFFKKKETPKEVIIDEREEIAQKGNAYIVLETFTTAYGERFKKLGKNANTFTIDDSLFDVTNEDAITTSHMLLDIHEALNIKLDYVPGDEYELFPTIGDVINYFISRFDFRINIQNPHLLYEE